MKYFSDIIKSPIVNTTLDSFWDDLPQEVTGLSPADVLVISVGYQPGSAEEVQLQKILQACKLSVDACNIIKTATDSQLPWYKLREALQPKTILLFGILPQQLGISAMFRMFTANHFNDCVWIASPSLADLETQPEAKKQLWQLGLKPIFDNPADK